MRIAIFATLLGALLTSGVARADDGLRGSSFWWPDWTVSTSENLTGKNDDVDYDSVGYAHPLISAFDGDAKTVWKYQPNYRDGKLQSEARALELAPQHALFVDAIRILKGDGAPLRQIRVTIFHGENRVVRTFNFSSKKGWKLCSLPRTKFERLRIEFPKSRRLNVAEIELQNRGRRVKMAMPRTVMFADGMEGCKPFLLLNRRGKVLDGLAADIGATDEWSQNGRYVCGLRGDDVLWIADTWRGRIVKKVKLSHDAFDSGYKWLDDKHIRLSFYDRKKDKNVPGPIIGAP